MAKLQTVTLREIARQAGVSPMTVSRVLRHQASVTPETRARVEEVARKLGYRPHPLVSALMSYRRAANPVRLHLSLGFVTSFATREGWKNLPLYREFFQGAAESADRHGYRLEEFWLREPNMTADRLCDILSYRKIEGLIVAPLPVAQGHLRLDWNRFSAVTFTYTMARPLLHRVVNHQFRSMRTAARQLRKLGYRRIGMAMPANISRRVDHQWVGSFLAERLRQEPKDWVPMCLLEDKEWSEERFCRWFLAHEPDVIISQQENILGWLANLGRRVPEDVGFVHLNCPDTSGKFAGIYQNGPAMGAAAVDFLAGMIDRNEKGIPQLPHTILVEGTWVPGYTVGKHVRGAR